MSGPIGWIVPPLFIRGASFGVRMPSPTSVSARPAGPHHLDVLLSGERRGIADMVAMCVRDQDHIELAELVQVLPLGRRLGVLGDEGIDQDHLSARRIDAKSGLPEPQQLGLPLTRESRRSERQA